MGSRMEENISTNIIMLTVEYTHIDWAQGKEVLLVGVKVCLIFGLLIKNGKQ